MTDPVQQEIGPPVKTTIQVIYLEEINMDYWFWVFFVFCFPDGSLTKTKLSLSSLRS